eukprot:7738980-Alexandrium_andersonii.AAC.1
MSRTRQREKVADTDAFASVPSCKHHDLCVRTCGGRQRRCPRTCMHGVRDKARAVRFTCVCAQPRAHRLRAALRA